MFTVGFICYIPQQNLLRVIVLVTFETFIVCIRHEWSLASPQIYGYL